VKPLAEFYRNRLMVDGHLNQCKACVRARVLRHREEHLEEVRRYDRERGKSDSRKAAAVIQTRKWRATTPGANAAHIKVQRAIRSGRLTPQPCERCGVLRVVAHHENYDRPLEVVRLCQPCHKARHAEIRRDHGNR
jgi:hypothetical protein